MTIISGLQKGLEQTTELLLDEAMMTLMLNRALLEGHSMDILERMCPWLTPQTMSHLRYCVYTCISRCPLMWLLLIMSCPVHFSTYVGWWWWWGGGLWDVQSSRDIKGMGDKRWSASLHWQKIQGLFTFLHQLKEWSRGLCLRQIDKWDGGWYLILFEIFFLS